jgi:hypothetical protein
MLLFSKLRRFTSSDGKGRRAKLIGFVVELLAGDCPPATHTLFRHINRALEVLADRRSSVGSLRNPSLLWWLRNWDFSLAVRNNIYG